MLVSLLFDAYASADESQELDGDGHESRPSPTICAIFLTIRLFINDTAKKDDGVEELTRKLDESKTISTRGESDRYGPIIVGIRKRIGFRID